MDTKTDLSKLMEAKGNLEASITQAIGALISDWKKENNAEITHISVDRIQVNGMGHPTEYATGFATVDILTKDGAEISSSGITYPVPQRRMDGKYR